MNKKSKIISIISISLLMISCIFVHTSFLTKNTLIVNKSSKSSNNNVLETPNTSDVSGSYNWGDGNSMDIETMDNTTTTTFYNQSYNYITVKSEKNDTYINTDFNDTASISCDKLGETPIQLHSSVADIYFPNYSTLDIEGPDYEIHTFAEGNYDEKWLDSFYVKTRNNTSTRFLNMSYSKSSSNGYDLNLLIGNASGHFDVDLDYDNEVNEFKWRDRTHSPYDTDVYLINESGVWEDNSQVIDWTNPDLQIYNYKLEVYVEVFPDVWMWIDIYQINISKYYDIITFHFYSIYLDLDLYEMIFTKNTGGIITMNFILLTAPVSFFWCQNMITYYNQIGVSMMIFTFYLWDIFDLLYSIMSEAKYLEVKFLWERMLVVWGSIFIEFWFSIDLFIVEIIISFNWAWWSYKIQIWYDIDLSIFISYLVWIEYYYSNYHWVYSFYVPTLILPNFLTINIIESIYTELWFYITIKVTDSLSNAINGATITGDWDGDSIGTVDNIGYGTYNFTLQAKFVNPGDNPLWLNLTAGKAGYSDGELNTEIAVESPPSPPEVTKQLIIKIVEAIYLDEAFNFIVEVTNCSGDLEVIDDFSGTWNGIDLVEPDNITDNGDGTFDLTLTPIYVPEGDDPIWLNLTAEKAGYSDGKLNTEIAVESPPTPPEVTKQLIIKIVEAIYLDEAFNFIVEVTNCSGDLEVIDDFSGTWNGIDLVEPDNITDNGDGTFDLTLTPIYVPEGDDPIWLNLTAEKAGYSDGELNTEIAVEPFYTDEPPPPPKQLKINIINSVYTSKWFNLTVEVTNCSGDRELGVILSGTWNDTVLVVSDNINYNIDGTFNLTLEAKLVEPGSPGIWLNLTATKAGYDDGKLKTKIAVDPNALIKFVPPPPPPPGGDDDDDDGGKKEEFDFLGPTLIITGISLAIGIVAVAIYLIRKRKLIR